MPNPLEYDGPPQQAASHPRDVFVRTLARPAPGPRAIKVRVWEGHAVGEPPAETERSREQSDESQSVGRARLAASPVLHRMSLRGADPVVPCEAGEEQGFTGSGGTVTWTRHEESRSRRRTAWCCSRPAGVIRLPAVGLLSEHLPLSGGRCRCACWPGRTPLSSATRRRRPRRRGESPGAPGAGG